MQILRNEIRTGIFVILTIGLTVGIVLYLVSPGLFKPLTIYHVYFDNAAGIKQGAPVMLAGRRIGTVRNIQSPVPFSKRPLGKPGDEVMITVQVSSKAKIYRETTVAMRSFGLLAELNIDFNGGDEKSGLAPPGSSFVGIRYQDLSEVGPAVIHELDPALLEATKTLAALKQTAQNLTRITEPDSHLLGTIRNLENVGGNLKTMTQPKGKVDGILDQAHQTLANIEDATNQLKKDNNLEKTLVNINGSSDKLKTVLDELQTTLKADLPKINSTVLDLSDLMSRLKKQPWRIIWPSTLKYQGQGPAPKPPLKRREALRADR